VLLFAVAFTAGGSIAGILCPQEKLLLLVACQQELHALLLLLLLLPQVLPELSSQLSELLSCYLACSSLTVLQPGARMWPDKFNSVLYDNALWQCL
jgi:hypothetical protein